MRLPVAVEPGRWVLRFAADGPVHVTAAADPKIPLVVHRVGHLARVPFETREPFNGFDLVPVEREVVRVTNAELEPAMIGWGLAPAWSLGPVRQPACVEPAAGMIPATPPSWDATIAIIGAHGVAVSGETLEVSGCGVVALRFTPPLGRGAYVLRARVEEPDGGSRAEAALLHPDAGAPTEVLAPFDPVGRTARVCRCHLAAPTDTLLLRPRRHSGRVRLADLSIRRTSPLLRSVLSAGRWALPIRRAPIAVRAAAPVRHARRTHRSGSGGADETRRGGETVSMIVATRDGSAHLSQLLSSLEATASIDELVLIDNGTRECAALALMEAARRRGAQVLRDPRPFNFAALNNLGARSASGSLLVFANNDIEFSEPGWLEALIAPLTDPAVGVTGALLAYPDGRIQHAGMALAGEAAVRHLHRGRRAVAHRERAHRTVPGVTAALMAVRRADFLAHDGFDAEHFGVLYNDIDLCLRLARSGLRSVIVPHCRAIHHESATIGQVRSRAFLARGGPVWQHRRWHEGEAFRRRWAATIDGLAN